jgi:AraC-like DNA-binding protein
MEGGFTDSDGSFMDGFVNIPVPVEHVAKVYSLLGKLADAESHDINVDTSGSRQLTVMGWTEEDLERLSSSTQASVRRIAQMLDLLSKSPGRHIAYNDIATSLHLSRGELQGALSGFSRWIRKNWDDHDGWGWPMDVDYRDAQAESQSSESYYMVDADVAGLWLTIRSRK